MLHAAVGGLQLFNGLLQAVRDGDFSPAWRAAWNGEDVPLTVTEFAILRTLAAVPARVFSRDGSSTGSGWPGFALTDRTIDSHVRNLRAKFAAAGGRT